MVADSLDAGASIRDKDFVIIARTDAVAATGGRLDEAVRRGREFARIGRDMVFCEFPSAEIEYPKRFAQEMHKACPGLPRYFNYSSNLKWHQFSLTTFDALADMGYKSHARFAGVPAPQHAGGVGLRGGPESARRAGRYRFRTKLIGHPMAVYPEFAGIPRFKKLEAKYLPPEEVGKKYDGAIGL